MDKERLKDLLFGYLNDTLSQEELDELLSYITIDDYTEVFHESMDQEWQNEKIKALLSDADENVIYTRILADQRFSKKEALSLTKRFRLFSLKTISAAAAILVIAVGAYLYSSQSRSHYDNDVNPGSTKAILTLADGRKITLDNIKKGELARQSGISIAKSADGQLVYTVTNAEQPSVDITYNTLETPKGGQYQVLLPDGTKVWLNAASSLKYPSSFASLKERKVTLSGEAYFEVAHNAAVPFRVVSAKQEIEVLGTHFNINSYSDEPATETTLLEGSVKVSQQVAGGNTVILKPGQQSQVSTQITITEADPETAVAWKNGDFILKDEDFKTIMRKIARWYDVDVLYDQSAPEDLELGGWVSRSKNISAVLKIMETTGKVHFKVQGRRVTVTK